MTDKMWISRDRKCTGKSGRMSMKFDSVAFDGSLCFSYYISLRWLPYKFLRIKWFCKVLSFC